MTENDDDETQRSGPQPNAKLDKPIENPEELRQKTHELNERMKELNCLYEISNIVENRTLSQDEILERIVEMLPPAWQYPEVAQARLTVGDKTYSTEEFSRSRWCLIQPLIVNRRKVGSVEVCYQEEMPDSFKGPFLRDEVRLIKEIADRIGHFLEKMEIESKFNANKEYLDKILGQKSEIAAEKRKKDDWTVILEMLAKTDPSTLLRLTRKMIYYLYRKDVEEIELVMSNVCPVGSFDKRSKWCGINVPNPRRDMDALEDIQRKVFQIAEDAIPGDEISNNIYRWLKEDKARPLLLASQRKGIPLSTIKEEILRYKNIPDNQVILSKEDSMVIRTSLIRRFFTSRLDYINIAKNYIFVEDFFPLVEKIIGPSQGEGKLGGKASGLFLAQKIFESEMNNDELLKKVKFTRSWHVTSDAVLELIRQNDLDEVIYIKYMDPSEIRQEQPFLEQIFKNAVFPSEITDGLRKIIREIGENPVIVRSSSLLEDSFGAAFSGKYKSLFLPNQGNEEERLINMMDAIAEVYASTLGPDPIEYRKERGLLDFSEEMGILIQEVVGTQVGPYYLPSFAGVAFSLNEFRWSPRIRRKDGIIRIVAGLGTRAVDRVSNDYPVIMSPKKPELRVNTVVEEIIKYSQTYMDVLNLEEGILETIPVKELISKYGDQFPKIEWIVSVHEDGSLKVPNPITYDPSEDESIVTFEGLVQKSDYLELMTRTLDLLEEKMGFPVDIEFAYDGSDFYLLQCRPQSQGIERKRRPVPKNIPKAEKVFSANRYVTTSHIENLKYIVYVVPEAYEQLESREQMVRVANAVGELNSTLPRRKFILMGPGRWGSLGDIKLGVSVRYRDINNTTLLVEIAKKKGNYLPDVSFGTHFFQDLVEADIHYLPLYPDEEETIFNEDILENAYNSLPDLLPKYANLSDVVRVIDVKRLSKGGTMDVVMDGEKNEALAYLKSPDHSLWRREKAEQIGREVDPDLLGIKAMYYFGSAKEDKAGPKSDIDILVHYDGNEVHRDRILEWFDKKSQEIAKENEERTGYFVEGMLEPHLITDEDIEKGTSWASHLDGRTGTSARKIKLTSGKVGQ